MPAQGLSAAPPSSSGSLADCRGSPPPPHCHRMIPGAGLLLVISHASRGGRLSRASHLGWNPVPDRCADVGTEPVSAASACSTRPSGVAVVTCAPSHCCSPAGPSLGELFLGRLPQLTERSLGVSVRHPAPATCSPRLLALAGVVSVAPSISNDLRCPQAH